MSGRRGWCSVALAAAAAYTVAWSGVRAATPPPQNWSLATAAKVVGTSNDFTRHGLAARLVTEGDHVVVVGTADLPTILQSQTFWGSVVHTGNTPFSHVLYTAAYQLNVAATVAVMHNLLVHIPTQQSFEARLLFRLPGDNGTQKVGLEFNYTRAADAAKYRDEDPMTVNVLKDTTNEGLALWLAAALTKENGEDEKVLTPEDIILDKDSLKGQSVAVTGFTACTNTVQMCMLYSDVSTFTKNIFYDASATSREERARLLSCSILAGCKITIRGTLVDEPLKMIAVTSMTWSGGLASAGGATDKATPSGSGAITVKDFILDRGSYVGRIVTVSGKAQCDGTSCWLTQAGWISEQNAVFDAKSLSRDDRKRLLDCKRPRTAGPKIVGRVTT